MVVKKIKKTAVYAKINEKITSMREEINESDCKETELFARYYALDVLHEIRDDVKKLTDEDGDDEGDEYY